MHRSHSSGPKPSLRRCQLGAFALLLLWATAFPARAQRVYRDRVNPHWFENNTRFWYRNDLPGGRREFVLVDARLGTRGPAFDAKSVAEKIAALTGKKTSADKLPIRELDFESDPGAVLLLGQDQSYRLDLASGQLSKVDKPGVGPSSLPTLDGPRPSRRTGDETSVSFENRLKEPIRLFWIDPAGRRQEYARVEPGKRWGTQSYDGHVWLATHLDGRPIATFVATREGGVAVVDGKAHPRVAHDPAGRNSRERAPRPEFRGPVSPDGKWALEARDGNLFVRNTSGGEAERLSDDGRPGDDYALDRVWWSPDSKSVAALRVEAGQEHKVYIVQSSPPDRVQPKLIVEHYLKPGDKIDHPRPELFRVADHRHVPIADDLFPNPWSIEDVRWSADSSRFTFVYNQRGHQALRVVAVDAADGRARAIVDEHSKTFIDYSGKYYCHWIGDDELIWMSERDGWNHLWLYDARAGKAKNLITPGEWPVRQVDRVDERNRQIWFRAGGVRPGQDPYYAHVCRANFDGTGLTILTAGDGDHEVDWSPDRTYFIDRWSRVDLPPVSELRRGADGSLVCRLESADASEVLAARGGRWPERFVAKGRDGKTDIYGILLFPRSFDPNRKYPLVELVYAGPQDFYTPKSFRTGYGTAQHLADLGFVVVQCDGMGTSGRSKAFHDVCWKNLRDGGFPDRIAFIRAAAKVHPQIDLSRVGVFGGSAGGQNAMAALLWHNDFYKVAVADCGCHDNRMDKIWWNEQWMGWPVDESYAKNSNVVNARMLKGKLMLVVGELDDNVDPASTMQVVNALEAADKDFELVVVTNAHHGATATPYGERRRDKFLVENLIAPTAQRP